MTESSLSPSFRRRGYRLKIGSFLICLALLNITGCDFVSSKKPKDLEQPPFAQKNISIEKTRDLAKSAANEDGFTVNPINNLNNTDLAGPIGLKTEQLFSTPIADESQRFARLESAVQNIADKLKGMSPSVKKLIGIEQDFDNLTFQLETLIDQGKYDNFGNNNEAVVQAAAPPPVEAPKAKAPAKKKKHYKKPKIQPGTLFKTMRIGEHPNKTRIVFETTEKLALTPAIDNAEKLLTIDLGAGTLGSDPNILSQCAKLFSSISQNQSGDNTVLVFELAKPTEKIGQGYIPPSKKNSAHRVFIDLKK